MKRNFLLSLLSIACVATLSAQSVQKLPVDSAVRIGHLDNGLTYYIRHNELPKQRAEFHIAQAVGAILEEDNQDGLAHFLEHMAFNGTEHFAGKGIINYFESIGVNFGGNINAYTSLDETVYRLSEVPTIREGIIDSALLVLHDWSHSLLLEGDEIDAERGVIREEWRTRASAERRMWSKMNPLKFPGSQYAKRDVIGDTAVINNFTYDALRDYYHKWYGPDLQAIVVVGDIDVDQIERKIKALWADVPERPNRGERPIYTVDDNKEPIVAVVRDEEAQLTRIRMDFKKNPLPKEYKQTELDYQLSLCYRLITQIMDNRFSEIAQKPDASIVGGGCGYGELVKQKDAFIGLVVAKHAQEKTAYQTLIDELERMRRYGFSEQELERAKTETLSSYEKMYNERNSVRNINYTREYIRNFLDDESIPGITWEYDFVKRMLPLLNTEILNQLAQTLVTDDNLIISFTAPESEEVQLPTEEEIKAMWLVAKDAQIEAPKEDNVDLTLVKKTPKAGKIKSIKTNEALGATEITLSNGVKVIVKPTEFKQDEIRMSAHSWGGTSLIKKAVDLPSANLASTVIAFSGIGHLNAIQLQKALTGKQVSVSPSINTFSESMGGSSTIKDFETMLQLTYLYFTAPRKSADDFQTLINLLKTSLQNRDKDPKTQFSDSLTMVSTNYSERSFITDASYVDMISLDKAVKIYKERFKNAADFTFYFVGNINPDDEKTQAALCQWLGSLPAKSKREHFVDRGVRAPKGVRECHFKREMQIKQTTNRVQFHGEMPYTLANDLNMEVIGRVLDIRYLESVREKEGGSYGVGVAGYLNRRPVPTAQLIVQYDTDPLKEERLQQIIYEEIETLAKEGPRADDLQKAKESMLKDFEEDQEKNGWWMGTVLPEYYRYGINYLTEYKDAVNAVSAETVKLTLKQLLDSGNHFEVIMEPVME